MRSKIAGSVKDQGLQNAQVVRHLSMYTKGLLVWRPVQMVATLDTVDVRVRDFIN